MAEDLLRAAILSAAVAAAVIGAIIGALLLRRNTLLQESIKLQFAQLGAIASSQRVWKERSITELLGPVYMQLDRTERAFARWRAQNVFLESKVIKEGNQIIRDLLLAKAHLIPPDLLQDAGLLVEHYDRWLEEFAKVRGDTDPDLKQAFVFVGPQGYPFPRPSAKKFERRFREIWAELYEGLANMPLQPTSGAAKTS
jgi:hypothetical protein